MKITIDTEQKTIEVVSATVKELKKVLEEYDDFTLVFAKVEVPVYPYWQYPVVYEPPCVTPYIPTCFPVAPYILTSEDVNF